MIIFSPEILINTRVGEAKTLTKEIQDKNLHPSLSELQFEQLNGIRFRYSNTPQMLIIRELEHTLEDTNRLADCINEWSDGDSWSGGFGNTKLSTERILKECFAIKLTR